MISYLLAQWMAIPPPIREPIKSALVSAQFTANSILGYIFLEAFQAGAFANISSLESYFQSHWLPAVGSFLYGAGVASSYRARQAQVRVSSPPQKGS